MHDTRYMEGEASHADNELSTGVFGLASAQPPDMLPWTSREDLDSPLGFAERGGRAVHVAASLALQLGRPEAHIRFCEWAEGCAWSCERGPRGERDRAVNDRVLTADDVQAIADAIAHKVAELLATRSTTFGFVDARELAEELGVSIDYVYAHARELGAMRLGSGPKARIRFDLDSARRALEGRAQRSTRQRRR